MRNIFLLLCSAAIAASLTLSGAAMAAPGEDLKTLTDEYWAWVLKEYPVFASSLGVRDYENEVSDVSLEAEDRRAKIAQVFLTRLEKIPRSALSSSERINRGILRRTLAEQIEGNGFGQRTINFTNRSGWHQQFADMANNLPFATIADYRSYVERLKKYTEVNDKSIAVARLAIKGGYTLPCDAMQGYESSISGLISKDPRKSRFFEPFTRNLPSTINAQQFAKLEASAESAIEEAINPALQQHHDWYVSEYAPNCAVEPGVSAQPGGAAYYEFRIRSMTTTTLSADEIHKIGLSEVARIFAEMIKVAGEAGFDSREVFIEDLRNNPKYYAKSPEELMQKVALVTKTIDGKMPGLFGKLARLPYGLKEIPAEIAEGTTTAYYNSGSPDVGIAGYYYVNTSKLDQRPFWEIPALSVHEGVPGHHHQIALQQELDLPDFRRHGSFFTAFVEGWGLYSERLGIEMGLYDSPAKDMGRLSYEMWRACRLVVDTGIHAKHWSKQKALDYMKDNTALTEANIEAEVNRYISWPGQALAYKIGELKIRELRARAEKALGEKFDLRTFHDAVLGQGAVPLDVLEAQIDEWIADQK
jgi:uncharacterized protein (DUF885 family)